MALPNSLANPRRSSMRTSSNCYVPTRGRAMSGNFRTQSSTRWCYATAVHPATSPAAGNTNARARRRAGQQPRRTGFSPRCGARGARRCPAPRKWQQGASRQAARDSSRDNLRKTPAVRIGPLRRETNRACEHAVDPSSDDYPAMPQPATHV